MLSDLCPFVTALALACFALAALYAIDAAGVLLDALEEAENGE